MTGGAQSGTSESGVRGMFVNLEVDAGLCAQRPDCRECVESCPVDIFVRGEGEAAQIVGGSEDECILCDQCVDRCAVDAVTLSKLY